MADLPIAATPPLSFLDDKGIQQQLPSMYIVVKSDGRMSASNWPSYATYQPTVDALVQRMQVAGILRAAPNPPARPAFQAEAKTAGGAGVSITIEVSAVVPNAGDPPSSTATVKVTEKDTYTDLPLAQLGAVLGTSTTTGTRPGLVFLGTANPKLPDPAGTPYEVSATGNKFDLVDATAAAAFSLKPRAGVDPALVKVRIESVDAATNTFTMVVAWTKSVTATQISALAAAFQEVLTITAPAGGYCAPNEGSYVLGGGRDAQSAPAASASVIVLTN